MMRHLLCAAMGLALAGNALEAAENQVTDGCIRHIWVRNYCMNPI